MSSTDRLWLVDAARRTLELAGWRWLFLLEGVPAVILGGVVLGYLRIDREARWLDADQRVPG
ncbi:MAG: hypothetical protein U0Q12_05415 [Vicinamibacterales bacterium]